MTPTQMSYRKVRSGEPDVIETYEHTCGPRAHRIIERTQAVRDGIEIAITCAVDVTPQGYERIAMTVDKGGVLVLDWTIDRSEIIKAVGLDPSTEVLLVDGPNFMFNWLNLQLLSPVDDERIVRQNVAQLHYADRSIALETYIVRRGEGIVWVDRGARQSEQKFRGQSFLMFPELIIEGSVRFERC